MRALSVTVIRTYPYVAPVDPVEIAPDVVSLEEAGLEEDAGHPIFGLDSDHGGICQSIDWSLDGDHNGGIEDN
jgi:hypothetical protein